MKKIRTKQGDVFKIPIDENSVCYGQVIQNINGVLRIVTFGRLYLIDDTPSVDKVLSEPIVLLTETMDAKIYHGHWNVYANAPILKHHLPMPYFKVGSDPIYITDFEGSTKRPATKDEACQLDFKFSVAPIRIQNAMQAFFKVKDWDPDFNKLTYNYCVEKSRIKI